MSLFRRLASHSDSADPHEWQFLDTFGGLFAKNHSKTQIPHPNVFRDAISSFKSDSVDGLQPTTSLPTAGHLAAYLCLCECFYNLEEQANKFNQFAPPSIDGSSTPGRDLLLQLAIDRFLQWKNNLHVLSNHAAFYGRQSSTNTGLLSKNHLPPLDVLFVWIAWLSTTSSSHNTAIPWEPILEAIDLDSLSYNISIPAQQIFKTITHQESDILEYLPEPPPYSDASALGMDDQNALLEQCRSLSDFVNQMHHLQWIRSPALAGTLYRSLAKFSAVNHNAQTTVQPSKHDQPLQLVLRTMIFNYQNPGKADEDFKEVVETDSECYCWICERVRDEDAAFSRGRSLPDLSKQQRADIKADIAFFRLVEDCRRTKPGTPLPTRPYTKSEVEERQAEQAKKDATGEYFGLGYVVKEKRPAIYDKDGRMIKPAKLKVTRPSATAGLNSTLASFAA